MERSPKVLCSCRTYSSHFGQENIEVRIKLHAIQGLTGSFTLGPNRNCFYKTLKSVHIAKEATFSLNFKRGPEVLVASARVLVKQIIKILELVVVFQLRVEEVLCH
jgi:hypothetical protein